MEILKCNAEFNKIYYVEYNNTLCQCKFIQTYGTDTQCYYILDIAGFGIQRIPYKRQLHFDKWYHTSETDSILYQSIEDYKKHKPIKDNYGSTSNGYNCDFIRPLFKYVSPCHCGGYTYTWKWNGVRAVEYIVSLKNEYWFWDNNGFHSTLNHLSGSYKSAKECEMNSKLKITTFENKED